MEAGADDLQTEEEYFEVTTSVDSFEDVRKALVDSGIEIENASLQWIAKNTIEVSGEAAEKVEGINKPKFKFFFVLYKLIIFFSLNEVKQ